MTPAIADALMKFPRGKEIKPSEFQRAVQDSMLSFGRRYPRASYGSAMRVSPVAWWFDELESV